MTERVEDHHRPDPASMAIALAGIARARKDGIGNQNPRISLGDGTTLNTGEPYTMDGGHWPGDGLTITGKVVRPDGHTAHEIVTIDTEGGLTRTELPEVA